MRRTVSHALMIAVFAAGLGIGFSGGAEACVSVPGDLRLVGRAIDSTKTPRADKAQLRRLRSIMLANRGTETKQIARYQAASRKALDLIGETTVVTHDAAKAAADAQASGGKKAFLGC